MENHGSHKILSFFIFASLLISCSTQKIPTIVTNSVIEITAKSASSGGTISDDGGADITTRGVCWSVYPDPTISDSKTVVNNNDNPFSSTITGLNVGSTYHVRAYAINSVGTAYGNDLSFTTKWEDADRNVYNSVTIGTQTWMTENLKVTKYNDYTPIPNITSISKWPNAKLGAYCWYGNDEALYKDLYGALYNWYAVNSRKLCPKGWHVATGDDWNTLVNYLGGESVAGAKLKATGSELWLSPNTGATNEADFTALPSGMRNNNGDFTDLGNESIWWSNEIYNITSGYCYTAYYNASNIDRGLNLKSTGLSFRCVKDN
jgi:uncharacterized protein (TIGR02145 family)